MVIGAGYPLSGPSAVVGKEMEAATKQVIETANAAGGINGKPIKLVVEDTQGDPTTAANVARKMITTEKVNALTGFYGTPESIAASNVAEQYKIPISLPLAAGSQTVTRGDKYLISLFPTVNGDTFPAKGALAYLSKQFAVKTASIVYVDQVPFSDDVAGWTRLLEKNGVKVTNSVALDGTAKDYTPAVTKLANSKTDMILTVGYGAQMAVLFKELKQFNVTSKVLFTDSISATEVPFVQAVGLVNGLTFCPIWIEGSPYKKANTFATQVMKSGKLESISITGVITGVAAQVLVQSLKSAKDAANGAEVAAAMRQPHETMLGKVSFDKTGLSNLTPLTEQIQNGKFVTVDPSNVATGKLEKFTSWN